MRLLALSLALCTSMASAASWQLDSEQSSLHFVSVKNELVAEVHQFNQLSGQWDGNNVVVTIPVSSMQTNIPIRNERIWQYVLHAEQFSHISLSAPLTDESIKNLPVGASTILDIPLSITIVAETAILNAKVRITRLSGKSLQAANEAPLMLNTNSFKLTAGVTKLLELAGLKRIDPFVPVSFNVRFEQQ